MAKGDKGKVVQVIGTVVDVGFDQNQLPEILNRIRKLEKIFPNKEDNSIDIK